jgi:hypothetical protein
MQRCSYNRSWSGAQSNRGTDRRAFGRGAPDYLSDLVYTWSLHFLQSSLLTVERSGESLFVLSTTVIVDLMYIEAICHDFQSKHVCVLEGPIIVAHRMDHQCAFKAPLLSYNLPISTFSTVGLQMLFE